MPTVFKLFIVTTIFLFMQMTDRELCLGFYFYHRAVIQSRFALAALNIGLYNETSHSLPSNVNQTLSVPYILNTSKIMNFLQL